MGRVVALPDRTEQLWIDIQKLMPSYALIEKLNRRLGETSNSFADRLLPLLSEYLARNGAIADLPKASGATGTIYVIGFASFVKIGWTGGPLSKRIASLSTGCPDQLIVYSTHPGKVADERALHRRFAALRLQGEWFRKQRELAAWIEAGCPLEG